MLLLLLKCSVLSLTNEARSTKHQQHLFHGFFSRTSWVSQDQKGKTIRDFNEARDDGVAVASDVPYAMQIICASLPAIIMHKSHDSVLFTSQMFFLSPNQRCQSTEEMWSSERNPAFLRPLNGCSSSSSSFSALNFIKIKLFFFKKH